MGRRKKVKDDIYHRRRIKVDDRLENERRLQVLILILLLVECKRHEYLENYSEKDTGKGEKE